MKANKTSKTRKVSTPVVAQQSVSKPPAPAPAVAAPAPDAQAKAIQAEKKAKAEAKRNALLSRVITVLVQANPKKPGSKSFARFALYKTGMTIGEFEKAGGRAGDVNWDTKHNFISIG